MYENDTLFCGPGRYRPVSTDCSLKHTHTHTHARVYVCSSICIMNGEETNVLERERNVTWASNLKQHSVSQSVSWSCYCYVTEINNKTVVTIATVAVTLYYYVLLLLLATTTTTTTTTSIAATARFWGGQIAQQKRQKARIFFLLKKEEKNFEV